MIATSSKSYQIAKQLHVKCIGPEQIFHNLVNKGISLEEAKLAVCIVAKVAIDIKPNGTLCIRTK